MSYDHRLDTYKPKLSIAEETDNIANISIWSWGDSLTEGSSTDSPYSALIGQNTGYLVKNGGVSGETSTQIATRMLANTTSYSKPTIIWAGRNNYANPETVKADVAAMVAALTTTNYIVIGVTNASTEILNSTAWTTITTLNNDLAALYGSKFIDIRTIVVNSYDSSIPQDVIDFGNDIMPSSLRTDAVHLNGAGQLIVANSIIAKIDKLIPSPNNNLLTVDNFRYIYKSITDIGLWKDGIELLNHISKLNVLSLGKFAGKANSTGTENVNIGTAAGKANTIGIQNTRIGSYSGQAGISANNTTSVGYAAAFLNETGAGVTALGGNAVHDNVSGSNITGVGINAAQKATGSNITAVGANAGQNVTSGAGLTAVGQSAGNALSTGTNTTAIGASAYLNINGIDNVAVGASAGRYQSDGSTPLASGTGGLYLGASTKGLANSLTNEIVIGYQAIGRGSNTVTLGSSSVLSTQLQGDILLSKTITASGTVGAQTINKPSGSVNFAAAATSLVVTNSLVTANSVIQLTVGTNDTTMKSAIAVAAAGNFTIYPNANPTAETRVNFSITN